MIRNLLKISILAYSLVYGSSLFSQSPSQTCPPNISFSDSGLTHWFAYTGNNRNGNGPSAIVERYDSNKPAPNGTINVYSIAEYTLPVVPGIQVLGSAKIDHFGSFPTVPTINGYKYNFSILLGSTSTAPPNSGDYGGYIRGVSYKFLVPASATNQPYTMTYAYAMVLENGQHKSADQPLISATISTEDSVITCASPQYYLPTYNDANPQDGDATLDSALAEANGFSLSPQLSPHPDPNSPLPNPPHLQDVWFKPWTEVTFDLSPYRGQYVTLTFEADNCVPGGHFAYGYIAIRNTCAGLIISGDSIACLDGSTNYSIPALAGATYKWSVPSNWVINSGANSNSINVTPAADAGFITAREQNGCADLADTIHVSTTTPTVPGSVLSNAEVCSGFNLTTLQLTGNTGNVLNWIGSTNGGQSWTPIQVQTSSYNATNLDSTTIFEAVVQHGFSCAIDSSSPSTIQVDPKSIGGNLLPVNSAYCLNQPINTLLQLNNHVGNIVTWQSSLDSINWSDFPDTDTSYLVNSLPATIHYRTIVKSGVCPLDTSQIANIYLYPAAFPQASIDPADTTICFGTSALLNADISIGTTYFWVAYDSLSGAVSGTIPSDPALVSASALPSQTADYVLEVENPGCPNALADTFLVNVIPPIKVSIVQDTSVVVGEPLQFNAISSDTAQDVWLWSPSSYLNNPDIPNPVARYGGETDSITYIVRATDAYSCYGQSTVSVKIYKTLPDIFVPTGFTPGQGVDNMFRPIPVGISKLNYFRVYNRWGQLVYETTQMGAGWNGIYKGRPQDSATFVWEVAGVDYLGNTIAKKGTVVLIR